MAMKNHQIARLSPRHKKSKLNPSPQKNNTNRPIVKNLTSSKSCFLQYFLYENLALRTPSVWISTQKLVSKGTWKRTRKQHQISSPRCPKSSQMGFQTHAKLDQNATLDPHVSLLLLPRSPKVLPRCQNSPQGCQNVGTRPPPKMTIFFGFGHKNALRANTQKPASQHTRFSIVFQ